MYKKIKDKFYNLAWICDNHDLYDIFMIFVIVLNLVLMILETVHDVYIQYKIYFHLIDIASIAIFTLDYLIRLWVCNNDNSYNGSIRGRLKFIFSFTGIVDMLSIIPSFIGSPTDLRMLRIWRLFRIFRILKLTKYCKSFTIIGNAIRNKRELLIASFLLIFVVLFLLSTIVYYCESLVQPDKYSSIPATMWWGVVTLTSVGYGDIYPITALGKLFTSIIALLSIPLCAIPGGIIFESLVEEMKK